MVRTEPIPASIAQVPDARGGGEFVLTFHCADSLGIVQAVSEFLLRHESYIVDIKQFGDRSEGHFFMRVHFTSTAGTGTGDQLREDFMPFAEEWRMDWRLERHGRKQRILVMVSKYEHCLNDLLVRARSLTARLAGKAINIHHSFLPSFKGAKPYHQAYERGVKTVGATAHYVNSELDEGPIIAQQVIEVDHTYTPSDLVAVGKDAECKALTNAVRWHAEGRIILSGSRTVILR